MFSTQTCAHILYREKLKGVEVLSTLGCEHLYIKLQDLSEKRLEICSIKKLSL